ncbi:citrinin biosynthesis transporter CtnC [Stemphylium lycopersici]|uniref:Citrinin biosynthesis transporter CtnC n=1 Tax=Stemphylium lycopersici TaxID=183478 RepID=A0A364N1L3_STELY|nr:citrinin biosynthesis transporter CtnC [Stemphylium lycopersici]
MAEPSINTQSTPESTQVEPLHKDDRLATEVEHENSQHDANPSSDGSPDLEKGSRDDGPSTADRNRFFVEFDGPNDPDNPKSWPPKRRWAITISMGLMVFTVTFASSIFSVNISVVQEKFSVELVTATLGVALFVLGFVFGPIAFGPMSEVLGRKTPLMFGFALFAIFQIPVALAQNITTVCVGRFLGGFFASAPLAVVGGALADLWDPIPRSYAICVFAAGGFAGPVAGPIAGGFITESYLGWRWTSWITLIMAGLFGVIGFFIIPETSAAQILQLRAARLRKESGDGQYHAAADKNKLTVDRVVNVYLLRPFIMFLQEPILALVTAYMSFLYGIVYLLFEAFPVSFYEERGWSLGVSQLPFGAFIVGILMGAGCIAYSSATNFTRAYRKHGKVIPEERLPPMIIGAIALPAGLFWFAWTSDPNTIWVPQVLSVALLGFGCMVPFWQAFICAVFLPVPILFYIYGARIRAKTSLQRASSKVPSNLEEDARIERVELMARTKSLSSCQSSSSTSSPIRRSATAQTSRTDLSLVRLLCGLRLELELLVGPSMLPTIPVQPPGLPEIW